MDPGVVELAGEAAEHGEVRRAEEEHVHPLDLRDRARVAEGAFVLDLDHDERLLVRLAGRSSSIGIVQ